MAGQEVLSPGFLFRDMDENQFVSRPTFLVLFIVSEFVNDRNRIPHDFSGVIIRMYGCFRYKRHVWLKWKELFLRSSQFACLCDSLSKRRLKNPPAFFFTPVVSSNRYFPIFSFFYQFWRVSRSIGSENGGAY